MRPQTVALTVTFSACSTSTNPIKQSMPLTIVLGLAPSALATMLLEADPAILEANESLAFSRKACRASKALSNAAALPSAHAFGKTLTARETAGYCCRSHIAIRTFRCMTWLTIFAQDWICGIKDGVARRLDLLIGRAPDFPVGMCTPLIYRELGCISQHLSFFRHDKMVSSFICRPCCCSAAV